MLLVWCSWSLMMIKGPTFWNKQNSSENSKSQEGLVFDAGLDWCIQQVLGSIKLNIKQLSSFCWIQVTCIVEFLLGFRLVQFGKVIGKTQTMNILNNVDDCHLLYFLWHSMVFNWFIFCIFRAAEVKERNKKDKNSVSRLRHCDRTPLFFTVGAASRAQAWNLQTAS